MQLYPLKFMPLFKPKVWGGNKIKEVMEIDTSPLPNCGEAWMLSGVEDDETVVENGFLAENTLSEVLEIYMEDLVGEKIYEEFGNTFPLLIKLIDANDNLSVQVHPDDVMAQKLGFENGKTEMWYVVDATNDATLISGFSKKTTNNDILKALKDKTLPQLLNVESVKKGDIFYIPAGRIHALCSGALIAEIQQTSDITYRLYDWDRVDEKGNSRDLHIKEALAAINFADEGSGKINYKSELNKTVELVNVPYFTTNSLTLTKNIQKDLSELDSFVIYMCLDGICTIKALDKVVSLLKGEVVLIPATAKSVEIYPETETKLLETYIIL